MGNILPHFGSSTELSREEFERRLLRDSTRDQVQGLRASLFADTVEKGFADPGDRLVMRKVGGGRTVTEKYAEDIWTLAGAEIPPKTGSEEATGSGIQ